MTVLHAYSSPDGMISFTVDILPLESKPKVNKSLHLIADINYNYDETKLGVQVNVLRSGQVIRLCCN